MLDFSRLTLTSYNHDITPGCSGKWDVSISELFENTLMSCASPSEIVGYGTNYGSALEDFSDKLEEYIHILIKFKKEIVDTSKAYNKNVYVDYMNNLLKGDCNGN